MKVKDKLLGAAAAFCLALMALVACFIDFSDVVPDEYEDSAIEEIIEHKIEQHTGQVVDLTKESEEK